MKRPMLIGIAGGTGSGKSTFAERLLALFPEEITVISYDNYYKPQDHLEFEERIKTNYDCPDALDTDLLVKHLRVYKKFFSCLVDSKIVHRVVAPHKQLDLRK